MDLGAKGMNDMDVIQCFINRLSTHYMAVTPACEQALEGGGGGGGKKESLYRCIGNLNICIENVDAKC